MGRPANWIRGALKCFVSAASVRRDWKEADLLAAFERQSAWFEFSWFSLNGSALNKIDMPTPPSGSASGSSGSKKPISVGISLDKKVACCPSNATCAYGEPCRKIVATGTAMRGDVIATDVQVTVTGPDGSMAVGNGTAVLTYWIRYEDCGKTIKFEASGADKKAEDFADIVKIKFYAMGNPHRVGISGKIDRTQHLTASVTPNKYAGIAVVTVGQFLTLTNVEKDPDLGLVKFDIVGLKPGSAKPGDTFVKVVVNDCVAERKISVVRPAKIAKPHQQGVFDVGGMKTFRANSTTSPGQPGIPANEAVMGIGAIFVMTIGVQDQFGMGIGDLYGGSEVTEGIARIKINQTLKADSTYQDPVGPANRVLPQILPWNDPVVLQWLAQPAVAIDYVEGGTLNFTVQIDGHLLDDAINGRLVRTKPPSSVEIIWPD